MEYINGKDIYSSGHKLTDSELSKVAGQIAFKNSGDYIENMKKRFENYLCTIMEIKDRIL